MRSARMISTLAIATTWLALGCAIVSGVGNAASIKMFKAAIIGYA